MYDLSYDLIQKHRGGLQHVVAAGMEQGVHGEVRTLPEVVGVAAPGHGFEVRGARREVRGTLLRVQPYADGRLLSERLQIALEPLFAHHLAGLRAEFFG